MAEQTPDPRQARWNEEAASAQSRGNMKDGKNIFARHYDETTGLYQLGGGSTLSPEGIYTDVDGNVRGGRYRVRLDGALAPMVPPQDGANPQPLPPLVPLGPGWPTPPEGFDWPNLSNPNCIYDINY